MTRRPGIRGVLFSDRGRDGYPHGLEHLTGYAGERCPEEVVAPVVTHLDLVHCGEVAHDILPLELSTALRQPLFQFVAQHESEEAHE
jgi:hypothetical protein